ncbi:hypothetical protein [Streptomyces sp. NPDC046832]|uniref:hypothetical protein n=1 Tax=Streptomyces sp. NPDC046832 TaxID=3155020 RepID=UPI0033CC2A4A
MSDHTPSQAEGDRDDEQDTAPRPTPSQAEGGRDDDTPDESDPPEASGTEQDT